MIDGLYAYFFGKSSQSTQDSMSTITSDATDRSAASFAPLWRTLVLVAVQAAITAWLFRTNLANGFSHVLGDAYDGNIEIAILEHWYNVFRGLAHWSVTNYFYPHADTLGYNDGYFFYGTIYSIFRATGADPFLSNVYVNMAMKALAFASIYWFSRQVFQLRFQYALTAATLFELSNNLTIHTIHAQLLTVAFAPACGTLLYFACRAFLARDAKRMLMSAIPFAVLYGVWAMTSYYTLWFFSFFSIVVILIMGTRNRHILSQLPSFRDRKMLLACAASLFLVFAALLPFLTVYLLKARETGMHVFGAVRAYALSLYDIMNIGPGNYVYGGLIPTLHSGIGFPIDFSENQMGMPPGLLFTFLAGSIYIWRRRAQTEMQFMLAVALAAILIWILTIKGIGWYAIYHSIPGAKAIRVISRYLIFLTFPVICIAMLWLSSAQSKAAHALAAIWCVFLIAEELNITTDTAVDRMAEVRKLQAVPQPPVYCNSFFVEDPRPFSPQQGEIDRIYRHNVDAMLISEYINLPTINGFSSFNPPGWNFAHPEYSDYIDRVLQHRDRHAIKGICSLNLQSMQWSDRSMHAE